MLNVVVTFYLVSLLMARLLIPQKLKLVSFFTPEIVPEYILNTMDMANLLGFLTHDQICANFSIFHASIGN